MHLQHRLLIAIGIIFMPDLTPAENLRPENKPKWELGIGLGALITPDYRGSKEIREIVLPIPYIRYYGKFIQADDGKLSGLFFKSDKAEFEISANASVTVKSKDNELREGMPELDPTFELGPAININLSGEDLSSGWKLRLPLRSVFAFGSDGIDQVGIIANPNVSFENDASNGGWDFGFTIGLIYGDTDYHNYYYTVEPQYATETRPAFQAEQGYSGLSSQITLSRRKNNIWYGGYLRYDNLSNVQFTNSPLLETKNYYVAGFGISWIFMHEKKNL